MKFFAIFLALFLAQAAASSAADFCRPMAEKAGVYDPDHPAFSCFNLAKIANKLSPADRAELARLNALNCPEHNPPYGCLSGFSLLQIGAISTDEAMQRYITRTRWRYIFAGRAKAARLAAGACERSRYPDDCQLAQDWAILAKPLASCEQDRKLCAKAISLFLESLESSARFYKGSASGGKEEMFSQLAKDAQLAPELVRKACTISPLERDAMHKKYHTDGACSDAYSRYKAYFKDYYAAHLKPAGIDVASLLSLEELKKELCELGWPEYCFGAASDAQDQRRWDEARYYERRACEASWRSCEPMMDAPYIAACRAGDWEICDDLITRAEHFASTMGGRKAAMDAQLIEHLAPHYSAGCYLHERANDCLMLAYLVYLHTHERFYDPDKGWQDRPAAADREYNRALRRYNQLSD